MPYSGEKKKGGVDVAEAELIIREWFHLCLNPDEMTYRHGTTKNNLIRTVADRIGRDWDTVRRVVERNFERQPEVIYGRMMGMLMEDQPLDLEDLLPAALKNLQGALNAKSGRDPLTEEEKWATEFVLKNYQGAKAKSKIKKRLTGDNGTTKPADDDEDEGDWAT